MTAPGIAAGTAPGTTPLAASGTAPVTAPVTVSIDTPETAPGTASKAAPGIAPEIAPEIAPGTAPGTAPVIGAVAIGRNEGARLERCLRSLSGQADRVVYVDSGSTDGSVALARGLGVAVVALDADQPFTAARGRNAGAQALIAAGPLDLIQFVDGDCAVDPGWVAAGAAFLAVTPQAGLVTGWRTEIAPRASIYNAMCEVEWHRPAGPIAACGGDLLVRRVAFEQVGGLNGALICSEDEDFVIRIRKAGWQAHRLPRIMTRHDAAITRFGQWWRRNLRSGHGFAEVGRLHPDHFIPERRRAWAYAGMLPLAVLAALALGLPWLAGVLALGWPLNWARTAQGLVRSGLAPGQAAQQAAMMTLAKLAHLIGMLTYHLRRLRGRRMTLIEYK